MADHLSVPVFPITLFVPPQALEVEQEEDVGPVGPDDDGNEDQEGCA